MTSVSTVSQRAKVDQSMVSQTKPHKHLYFCDVIVCDVKGLER